MRFHRLLLASVVLCVSTTGCASNTVQEPATAALNATVSPIAHNTTDEVAQLLTQWTGGVAGEETPRTVRFTLCEREAGSRECSESGIGLFGLGGLVLPLRMRVREMTLSRIEAEGDTWTARSKFKTRVNGIPPACRSAELELYPLEEGDPGSGWGLRSTPFYCNWLIIGNVSTRLGLHLEDIDPDTREIWGTYRLSIRGTGNGTGTGYFLAKPAD